MKKITSVIFILYALVPVAAQTKMYVYKNGNSTSVVKYFLSAVDSMFIGNTSYNNETRLFVFTNHGKATIDIEEVDSIIFVNPEKCNASDYKQVKIGKQTWLAENYCCSKYDTESEAYKENRFIIEKSNGSDVYTPCYMDPSVNSTWYSSNDAKKLTEDQIEHFGYLYNWAAAVGVADGQLQTAKFNGKRQGICPNGWHVPTKEEWNTLYEYVGCNVSKLKSKSGWYDNIKGYKQGVDTYGFSALPAGHYSSGLVYAVGFNAIFLTASPNSVKGAKVAYSYYMVPDSNTLCEDATGINKKNEGLSVRCVKN